PSHPAGRQTPPCWHRPQQAAHAPSHQTTAPLAPPAHRLSPPRPRRAGALVQKTTPSSVRPPPRRLRSQETPRQTNRSADRPHSPLPDTPPGLRAMAALVGLRNKAIKPLLAAALPLRPTRGPHNPRPIDTHYRTIQMAMQGVFHELGLAA